MNSLTRLSLNYLGAALSLVSVGKVPAADAPSFGTRLGWRPDQLVVILHVDDVGMSRSSNLGATEAVGKGVATSWAVMMPCPWVPDIARYFQAHPKVDSGLHLTLTSEWAPYRWGPLAGKSQVPGLVDPEGCLWRNVAGVVAKASADEIERAIRAQVDRAETLGMPLTHLDSQMGTLFARPDFFERFAKVGMEKRIPVLAVGGHATYTKVENTDLPDLEFSLHDEFPKLYVCGNILRDSTQRTSGTLGPLGRMRGRSCRCFGVLLPAGEAPFGSKKVPEGFH